MILCRYCKTIADMSSVTPIQGILITTKNAQTEVKYGFCSID
jgi:hypothetical protein